MDEVRVPGLMSFSSKNSRIKSEAGVCLVGKRFSGGNYIGLCSASVIKVDWSWISSRILLLVTSESIFSGSEEQLAKVKRNPCEWNDKADYVLCFKSPKKGKLKTCELDKVIESNEAVIVRKGLVIIFLDSKKLSDKLSFKINCPFKVSNKKLTDPKPFDGLICRIVRGHTESFIVEYYKIEYVNGKEYVLSRPGSGSGSCFDTLSKLTAFGAVTECLASGAGIFKDDVFVGVLNFFEDQILPVPFCQGAFFGGELDEPESHDTKEGNNKPNQGEELDEPESHDTKEGNNKPNQDNLMTLPIKQTVSLDLNSGAESTGLIEGTKEADEQAGERGADCKALTATEVSKAKAEKLKQIALDKGFEVVDNPGDGDCMYHALSHQLNLEGISCVSYKELRATIADYVEQSGPKRIFPFVCDEYRTWKEFLRRIRIDGTWGDQWTLQAAADYYKTCIRVVNSESQENMISPKCGPNNSKTVLVLGHVPELHYVSFQPKGRQGCLPSRTSLTDGTNECEKEADISSENNELIKQTVSLDLNSGAESRKSSLTVGEGGKSDESESADGVKTQLGGSGAGFSKETDLCKGTGTIPKRSGPGNSRKPETSSSKDTLAEEAVESKEKNHDFSKDEILPYAVQVSSGLIEDREEADEVLEEKGANRKAPTESRKGSLTVGGSKNGDAFSPGIRTSDGKLPGDGNSDQSYRTFRSTETLAEETNISLKDETRLPVQESSKSSLPKGGWRKKDAISPGQGGSTIAFPTGNNGASASPDKDKGKQPRHQNKVSVENDEENDQNTEKLSVTGQSVEGHDVGRLDNNADAKGTQDDAKKPVENEYLQNGTEVTGHAQANGRDEGDNNSDGIRQSGAMVGNRATPSIQRQKSQKRRGRKSQKKQIKKRRKSGTSPDSTTKTQRKETPGKATGIDCNFWVSNEVAIVFLVAIVVIAVVLLIAFLYHKNKPASCSGAKQL